MQVLTGIFKATNWGPKLYSDTIKQILIYFRTSRYFDIKSIRFHELKCPGKQIIKATNQSKSLCHGPQVVALNVHSDIVESTGKFKIGEVVECRAEVTMLLTTCEVLLVWTRFHTFPWRGQVGSVSFCKCKHWFQELLLHFTVSSILPSHLCAWIRYF